MSVRRILAKTIDTDLEYEAIGIDLAKNCVSAALLTTDGEVNSRTRANGVLTGANA